MDPAAIHNLILVRSVEEADQKGEHLTWTQREEASMRISDIPNASAPAKSQAHPTPAQWQALSARASFLKSDAESIVGLPFRLPVNPTVIGLLLCGLAFLLGAMSHQVGLSRSFDIIAGPFMMVFIWNAFIYALLIYRFSRAFGSVKQPPPFTAWLASLLQRGSDPQANSARRGYRAAYGSWLRSWAIPMLSSLLHSGSACFALGLLAAIYIRGLNTAYYAGWESAWLTPNAVKSIVGTILGPASWISGISLPQTDAAWRELERTPGNPGIKANMWIHLYAITMIGWVVLPRLGLAAYTLLRGQRLRSTPPAWRMDEPYVRRIFNTMKPGETLCIGVLPYDFQKLAGIQQGAYRDALDRLIREAWGQSARSQWFESLGYGSEDEGLDPVFSGTSCDGIILLFDMRSTPEDEVHGCFLDAVVQRFRGSRGGILMAVETMDCDTHHHESSLTLWKKLATQHNVQLLPLNSGAICVAATNPSLFIHHPN